MPHRSFNSFKSAVWDSARSLIDLVFPPSCAGCKGAGSAFCDSCAQAVEPVSGLICQRCGRAQPKNRSELCAVCRQEAQPLLTLARAAAFHTEPLSSAIHQLKYGKQPELAAPLVRYLLTTYASSEWRSHKIDIVAPIPMFAARKKERGYNQAELLARHFCKQTKYHLEVELLQRVRFTQPQVGLNAQQRLQNVEDAFAASNLVQGRSILLIDDVYTTGATLRACAKAALDQGASQVYGLALATPTVD